jgi:hypothetical protein
MAEIFKISSETCIFVILVSKLQFLTDFKNPDCIRSVCLLFIFCRKNFFSKIQNGGLFEDDVNFDKKIDFFQTGPSHPKLIFFKFSKSNLLVQKTQNIPKKFAKEHFPRWRIFSKRR